MQSLSRDVYISILDYVDYFDQITCTCCCKYLYRSFMNPYVRCITIDLSRALFRNRLNTYQLIWKPDFLKLVESINDQQPYRLRLEFGSRIKTDKNLLSQSHRLALQCFPKAINEIHCTPLQFQQLLNIPTLEFDQIKQLEIVCLDKKENDYEVLFTNLVIQCSSLYRLTIDVNQLPVIIPHISSLHHLDMSHNHSTRPIPVEYRHQLLSLKLSHCRITDVTMLGEIPRLELDVCRELEDISALTHNQQSIRIAYCSKVREVCQVFLITRSIELEDLHPAAKIDMTSWKQVKQLSLAESELGRIKLVGDPSIPLTVRDCSLKGNYVEIMDLRITKQHCLRTLRISASSWFRSVTDLRFEQLVALELNGLSELSVLADISGGISERVAIRNCHKIQDFSLLRTVKDVSLISCASLSLEEQLPKLEQVRSLQLGVGFFHPRLLSCLSHPIQTLDLSLTLSIACFEGLETIPHLILYYSHLKSVLFEYVVNGGKLNNQRIELVGCIYSKFVVYYLSMYELYLKEDYMMFWKPSNRVDIGNVSFLRRVVS